MVDLHLRRGADPASEKNRGGRIGIVQGSGQHGAAVTAWFDHQVGEVPMEDVVAGVAAVVTAGGVVVVGPGFTELVPGVAGLGGAAFHWQRG